MIYKTHCSGKKQVVIAAQYIIYIKAHNLYFSLHVYTWISRRALPNWEQHWLDRRRKRLGLQTWSKETLVSSEMFNFFHGTCAMYCLYSQNQFFKMLREHHNLIVLKWQECNRAHSLPQAKQIPAPALLAGPGSLLGFPGPGTWTSSSVYKDTNTPGDLLSNVTVCASTRLKPWLTVYIVRTKSKPDVKNGNVFSIFLNMKDMIKGINHHLR